jgi:hypothetical protein
VVFGEWSAMCARIIFEAKIIRTTLTAGFGVVDNANPAHFAAHSGSRRKRSQDDGTMPNYHGLYKSTIDTS